MIGVDTKQVLALVSCGLSLVGDGTVLALYWFIKSTRRFETRLLACFCVANALLSLTIPLAVAPTVRDRACIFGAFAMELSLLSCVLWTFVFSFHSWEVLDRRNSTRYYCLSLSLRPSLCLSQLTEHHQAHPVPVPRTVLGRAGRPRHACDHARL